MKTLLIIVLMAFSSNAMASGFKIQVGPELTKSEAVTTHPGYNESIPEYAAFKGTVKDSKWGVRASCGYEQDISELFAADVMVGSNTDLLTRSEVNLVVKVNEKINLKAGPNITHKLNGASNLDYSAGVGGQIGAEYKLEKGFYINLQAGLTHYSYTTPGSADPLSAQIQQRYGIFEKEVKTNVNDINVLAGVGIRF
jgi:hypothetical protein